jgi:multidrug efflux pump subunit AcrA (membrane-fusion protein)
VESAEISVHIDPANWSLLPETVEDAEVTLFDTGQSASWQAGVLRKSNHLNSKSRLRTLVLQVTQPLARHPQLLSGTFVRAEIIGRQVPDLLRIPESALTSQGLVWFVDRNKQLRKFPAEPLFYRHGVVYIPVPETIENTPVLVAVSPNSSFVSGLVIQPLPEKRTQDDT